MKILTTLLLIPSLFRSATTELARPAIPGSQKPFKGFNFNKAVNKPAHNPPVNTTKVTPADSHKENFPPGF